MSGADTSDTRPVLALFDFDGTITTRDTLPDFLRYAIPPRRLRLGKLLFALPVMAYKLKLLPVSVLRTLLVRYAFGGLPQPEVEAAGRRFAATVLPPLVRPEMQARIDAHRERGDTVVVVSAGFDVYLAPWCEAQGVELVCSSMEARDGHMTGRYAGAQCAAEEKVRRVRERYDMTAYREVHAHGDTHEDRALLRLAHMATYRGMPWRLPK
ncbi:HAD family hydrolase [Luteimonas sp. 3794]|uniref:HAD family hydrolase n=1 Tax=Luteimonas sp. 3794 TaxID=2817730 RepID=UPI002855D8AA|nr:HAD family hydrolase [Luteimonas sp. 3794]MDR6989977.1 HAD superfamily hydrolase (TIGR01490 family) [Luteimonas sp. 3794]